MNTKEKIAVMQAFMEGKEIQVSTRHSAEWKRLTWMPEWDWTSYNYRIKPEPKFVYVNVYSCKLEAAGRRTTNSSCYTHKADAEKAAIMNGDTNCYYAIALPVELKEQ